MNGLDLLVIAAAVAAAIALLRQGHTRRPAKLVGPAEAVRRDGARALPPITAHMLVEPKSEQQEAYDRWLVSDEADPHKLPAATAHLTINEPPWRDPAIRSKVEYLGRESEKEQKR